LSQFQKKISSVLTKIMPTILFFFCGHGCILSVAHISSGQTSCDVS